MSSVSITHEYKNYKSSYQMSLFLQGPFINKHSLKKQKYKTLQVFFFHQTILFIYFFNFFLLMFEYSCHHFPTPSLSYPSTPPTLNPSPTWLHPWVPHSCSFMSLPFLSQMRLWWSPIYYFPLPSPLVTASLLSISMSLTILCLPVCLVN